MDAAVAYWFAEAIPSFPLHFFPRRGQVIQVLDSLSVFEHGTCSQALSLVKNEFNQFYTSLQDFAILVISGCGDF